MSYAERGGRRSAKKVRLRKGRFVLFLAVVAVIIIAGVALLSSALSGGPATEPPAGASPGPIAGQEQPSEPKQPDEPEPEPEVALRIVCVGDVMAHATQITAQYNSDGTYDFTNNFQHVKGYIQEADLALCNLETTFAGGTPSGYPVFNAPDSLASALADAGFDVAMTSNNHLLDKGLAGMKRTVEILQGEGMKTAGVKQAGQENYTLTEVNGVTIAVVSYTYETPRVNGRRTLNGNYISDEAAELMNSFSYESLEEDLKQVWKDIADAKEAGADIVICYYHWGEEYQRTPNSWQKQIAAETAEKGADIIFASHPHVLQGLEMLSVGTDGKQVPVFYSMGNFISNQRAETLENRYTEQGMIAGVNLEYSPTEEKIVSLSVDVIPTWVDRYKSSNKYIYGIIPLDDDMENNSDLKASGHLNRATQALEDVKALVGDQYIRR